CVSPNQPSIWLLLFPYLEQQTLYDMAVTAGKEKNVTYEAPMNCCWPWYNQLPEDMKKGFAVSYYNCPSRRSGGNILSVRDEVWPRVFSGPRGDYAVVITKSYEIPDYHWWHCYGLQHFRYDVGAGAKSILSEMRGPFRPAQATFDRTLSFGLHESFNECMEYLHYSSWTVRDNFSFWSDGTSNQLLIGEKHVPANALGQTTDAGAVWDGGYLVYWEGHIGMAWGRFIGRNFAVMARGPNDPRVAPGKYQGNGVDWADCGFGSAHTSVCNFVLGDGSVHGITTTVSPTVLHQLACTNDGNAVSIP
ncbi:MAG: DUF1559 domain-containing protein, partial [Thermoguttaceae bacterium]